MDDELFLDHPSLYNIRSTEAENSEQRGSSSERLRVPRNTGLNARPHQFTDRDQNSIPRRPVNHALSNPSIHQISENAATTWADRPRLQNQYRNADTPAEPPYNFASNNPFNKKNYAQFQSSPVKSKSNQQQQDISEPEDDIWRTEQATWSTQSLLARAKYTSKGQSQDSSVIPVVN